MELETTTANQVELGTTTVEQAELVTRVEQETSMIITEQAKGSVVDTAALGGAGEVWASQTHKVMVATGTTASKEL